MEHLPNQQPLPTSSSSHGRSGVPHDENLFPGSPGVYRRLGEDLPLIDDCQHHQSQEILHSTGKDKAKNPAAAALAKVMMEGKTIPGIGLNHQASVAKSERHLVTSISPVMVSDQVQQRSTQGPAVDVRVMKSASSSSSPASNHPDLRVSQSLQLRTIPHEILRKACSSGSGRAATPIPGMAPAATLYFWLA